MRNVLDFGGIQKNSIPLHGILMDYGDFNGFFKWNINGISCD